MLSMRLKVFDLETEIDRRVVHAAIERAERTPQPLRNRDMERVTGSERTSGRPNQIARRADIVGLYCGRERFSVPPRLKRQLRRFALAAGQAANAGSDREGG